VASAAAVVGSSLTASWGKMREGLGYLKSSGSIGSSPKTGSGDDVESVESLFAGSRPSYESAPSSTAKGLDEPKLR
jgi:hypothetical protein